MTSGPVSNYFDEVRSKEGAPAPPLSRHGLDQKVYRVGSRNVVLFAEDSLAAGDLLDVSKEEDPHDRTGMLLWPGSTAMAHALLRLGEGGLLAGRSVLELGSGVGFCGVVAGFFAQKVVLTDQSAEARRTASENLCANGHVVAGRDARGRRTTPSSIDNALPEPSAEVLALAWKGVGYGGKPVDETGSRCFDLVIASDVLYVDEPRFGGLDDLELRGFFSVVLKKLSPGGLALLSYACREPGGGKCIHDAAKFVGLECKEVPVGCLVPEAHLHAAGAWSLNASKMFFLTHLQASPREHKAARLESCASIADVPATFQSSCAQLLSFV